MPKVVFDKNSNLLSSSRAGIPSNELKFKGFQTSLYLQYPLDSLKLFQENPEKAKILKDIEITRF